MTIQIELTPEAEARLTAEAQAFGLPTEEYAGRLLQSRLTAPLPPNPSGRLSVEEVRIMLAEIARGSENLPDLPTSSFTRESFYEDRT